MRGADGLDVRRRLDARERAHHRVVGEPRAVRVGARRCRPTELSGDVLAGRPRQVRERLRPRTRAATDRAAPTPSCAARGAPAPARRASRGPPRHRCRRAPAAPRGAAPPRPRSPGARRHGHRTARGAARLLVLDLLGLGRPQAVLDVRVPVRCVRVRRQTVAQASVCRRPSCPGDCDLAGGARIDAVPVDAGLPERALLARPDVAPPNADGIVEPLRAASRSGSGTSSPLKNSRAQRRLVAQVRPPASRRRHRAAARIAAFVASSVADVDAEAAASRAAWRKAASVQSRLLSWAKIRPGTGARRAAGARRAPPRGRRTSARS